MNEEPPILQSLSSFEPLGDITTLSLSELLSLLYLDDKKQILIPSINHHWFQGHLNRNVIDIKNSYAKFFNPTNGVSESGPSKDYVLSFFKVTQSSNHLSLGCKLYFTDGKRGPSNVQAFPVSKHEKTQIIQLITSLQELSKNPDSTLDDMRRYVTEKGYFIAPVDGLHRISVLHELHLSDPSFISNCQRKAVFSPSFVFVSSNEGEYFIFI